MYHMIMTCINLHFHIPLLNYRYFVIVINTPLREKVEITTKIKLEKIKGPLNIGVSKTSEKNPSKKKLQKKKSKVKICSSLNFNYFY